MGVYPNFERAFVVADARGKYVRTFSSHEDAEEYARDYYECECQSGYHEDTCLCRRAEVGTFADHDGNGSPYVTFEK